MNEWNLKNIYPSEEAWEQDYQSIKERIPHLGDFKGKLNEEKTLEEFFLFQDELEKSFEKFYSFIAMSYDKDQKNLSTQARIMKARSLFPDFGASTAYINTELLQKPYSFYEELASHNKVIKEHLFSIKQTFDSKKYVLLPNEEKIISDYSMVTSSFARLYSMLQNSDFSPIEVTLSTNEVVKVSPNTYTSILMNCNKQDDRKKVFEALFGYYDLHKNTLCSIYKGIVDSDIARMKVRNYPSILESVLDHNKIPQEVYLSLINTVKENTAPLQRYIKLRKEFFNLSTYHTYDRFLSFSSSNVEYPYSKAYEDVLKALEPMGEDFLAHAKVALEEGHVDVYPSEGKRSGAYSTQVYGHGPYILLNHTNTLDSAFTLAHECGHSIHTLYSNENQPYATKDYTIFVAEIASTFNEQVFLDYLMKNSNDKELKIQALEQQIDGIVSTFYRQTLFADFEYQAHMLVLENKPFTYESLNNIMADLYKKYYGIGLDEEPLKKMVWAYIPHMYNTPFYVYQYATCFSASMKIYQDVKNNVPGAFDKYISMLKMGGCNYPVEIVKAGGVDLTTKEPFLAVCNKLDELLNEFEKLVK